MNKSQMVSEISSKANLSKEEANRFLNAGMKVIADALIAGKSIKLKGIAKFEVVSSSERIGRNFQTGTLITIKARKKVRFKGSPTPH